MTKKSGAAPKGSGKGRKRKSVPPSPRGLSAVEVSAGSPPEDVLAVGRAVGEQGGCMLATYRDPIGGHWQIVASLPLECLKPTPFQRDLSETHVARLGDVIGRMGRFLDPIVAVQSDEGGFWTPNGHHRLAAMQRLGARSILAVVVPDSKVAYQILAMNTEKGHNLREKSLEVVRMARTLAGLDTRPERELALEFEEPDYLTLGLTYERRGRFSGGAYHPVLRRTDEFLDAPLAESLQRRSEWSSRLLELDDGVIEKVAALKERGLASPYLKSFVVARINPLRFKRGATMGVIEALEAMTRALARFDPEKVQVRDLAGASGPPAEQ